MNLCFQKGLIALLFLLQEISLNSTLLQVYYFFSDSARAVTHEGQRCLSNNYLLSVIKWMILLVSVYSVCQGVSVVHCLTC